jgi:hypothetical protein
MGLSRCLYAELLGSAWDKVPQIVRHSHLCGDNLHAQGSCRIVRGTSLLAQFLGFAFRLPKDTQSTTICLKVTRLENGELWHRSFEDQELVTIQSAGPHRLLVEQLGPLEFRFRLDPNDGALYYKQHAFGLRLGQIYIPIPAWASPQVAAREGMGGTPDRSAMAVAVTVPVTGVVLRYEGEIQILENRAS